MNKSKFTFLVLSFAGLILSGCGNGGNGGGNTSTSTTSGPDYSEISGVIETIKDTLNKNNITMKMEYHITSPDREVRTSELRELDQNKIHIVDHTILDDNPPIDSELYYEAGETNYMYQYDGEKWIKLETASTPIVSFAETAIGFDEIIAKFKESYTKPSDGVYEIKNFTYDVSVAKVLETIGADTTGYTLAQETIAIPMEYFRVTVSNGVLVTLEQKTNGVTPQKDEDNKTISLEVLTNNVSETKIYDIEKIGSTVVNLPVVA